MRETCIINTRIGFSSLFKNKPSVEGGREEGGGSVLLVIWLQIKKVY